eukprot:5840657-Prorocentrum_lima.AAC.1
MCPYEATSKGCWHGKECKFKRAPLDPVEDGIILVQPPSLLVKLGIVQPGALWKLKKSLYGLRCAPKRW